jgi:hypothetical protein
MFVYKSQNGICLCLKLRRKINASIKLKKFIKGANHPRIIENSINGCGINCGAVE